MSKSEENNQEGESENEIICLLGAAAVGKTSIIFRYINNRCPSEHDPTVEDDYKFELKEIGKGQQMTILDTGGEDDYKKYVDGWIKRANYFLLVFSKDVEGSDTKIELYYNKIMNIKHGKKISIIIVENKTDSLNGDNKISEKVDKFAESKKLKIIRCSALMNEKIKDVFDAVIKDYINFEESKRCCDCCLSF